MNKRLAHHSLVILLVLFTIAGVVGIVRWQQQGLRFYSVSNNNLAPTMIKGDLILLSTRQIAVPGQIAGYINPADFRQIVPARVESPNNTPQAGKVVKSLPLAGYLLNTLRRPAGLAIMVYVPAFMILRAETKRLARRFGRQPYAVSGFNPFMRHSSL